MSDNKVDEILTDLYKALTGVRHHHDGIVILLREDVLMTMVNAGARELVCEDSGRFYLFRSEVLVAHMVDCWRVLVKPE